MSVSAAPDRARSSARPLTVAVTGATGTIGPALLRRLVEDPAVGDVRVLGRTAPVQDGVEFLRADVRDATAVRGLVDGADVVVHAAFAIYGARHRESTLFATNVLGTRNVAHAAAQTGAARLVYTSSAAVYGFHPRGASPLTEDAPVRASGRHFYGRHKAQAELLVQDELRGSRTEAYVFRPGGIIGPHAAGAIVSGVPAPVRALLRRALVASARAGMRPAVIAPPYGFQFVHEDDVAQALLLAVHGAGSPGIYNLVAEDEVSGAELVRLLGLRALPVPRPIVRGGLRALAAAPSSWPVTGWADFGTAPLLLDPGRAREDLSWSPRWSSREAVVATREGLGW